MTQTQQLSKPSPAGEFSALLERSKGQIAKALPKHLTPERMIRMAVTAFSSTPLLQQCAMPTIIGCVVKASELGLELTGPLGHAYMVPRRNKKNGNQWEANFQVGYRGFIDLAYRTGRVKTFCAHEVCENDHFEYQLGTDPYIVHKPARSERGEITHVYAVCIQTNGGVDFEVMSKDEIDAHARKYSDSFNSDYSPWKTAWAEMAKKTPIRKLAKRVPLSAEFAKVAIVDEYAEAGVNPTPMMIEGATTADELPTGRTKIKDLQPTNGNGNGHAEESLKLDTAGGEVPNESTDSAASAEDVTLNLQDAIETAATTKDLQAIGVRLNEVKAAIGEASYKALLTISQEAYRALEAKEKKGSK